MPRQIYNEEVRDLLDDQAGPQGQLLRLKLSSNEAVGNVRATARDEGEVERVLRLAQGRRCVKATNSNAESSRSHMLFTIRFDVLAMVADGRGDDGAGNTEHVRGGCLRKMCRVRSTAEAKKTSLSCFDMV